MQLTLLCCCVACGQVIQAWIASDVQGIGAKIRFHFLLFSLWTIARRLTVVPAGWCGSRGVERLPQELSVTLQFVRKQITTVHPSGTAAAITNDGVKRVQSLIGFFAQVLLKVPSAPSAIPLVCSQR